MKKIKIITLWLDRKRRVRKANRPTLAVPRPPLNLRLSEAHAEETTVNFTIKTLFGLSLRFLSFFNAALRLQLISRFQRMRTIGLNYNNTFYVDQVDA